VAKYDEKEIITYRWNENFLDGLLPHELTHLIFRDFVGFPARGEGIPLWIDEGIAEWQEASKKGKAEKIVRGLIARRENIPIEELMRLDIREVDDYVLTRNFYAQAITLVGYMMDEYGGGKFTLFCRALRDGKNVDEALASVYRDSIDNVSALERKWIEYYRGG
jgi:hypothetical protein